MSQTAIPLEFEQYLQNKISIGKPTDLNEIIFAHIPDLDLSQPIDRTVTLPPKGQWVFQQDIDQLGKSGSNAVVYSVVISGSTAPFTFNAMFLRDKAGPNSCAMVVYKAEETKETGMALTKSMLMQFDGAAAAANVSIDAATWQIDYSARLKGMDEDHRLHCLDNYGHTAFIEGFGVTRHEVDQSKYLIAPGVVYLGGLRVKLAAQLVQTIHSKPITLWLDAYRDGTVLSAHENLFQVVTNDALIDYTDDEGRDHYVCPLAQIDVDGAVVDLRVLGGVQMAAWNFDRVYITGEICSRMIDGQMTLMQMYAGPNMMCKGKDPADPVNRHNGWARSDAPFWWIDYKANIVGMPFYWLAAEAPEWAVMEIGVDLPVAVYWRLANTYPHLVLNGIINTGDVRGEFIRVWDAGRGVDMSRQINSAELDTVGHHNHLLPTGSGTKGNDFWGVTDAYWMKTLGFNDQPATGDRAVTFNSGWNVGSLPSGRWANETAPRSIARAMAIFI